MRPSERARRPGSTASWPTGGSRRTRTAWGCAGSTAPTSPIPPRCRASRRSSTGRLKRKGGSTSSPGGGPWKPGRNRGRSATRPPPGSARGRTARRWSSTATTPSPSTPCTAPCRRCLCRRPAMSRDRPTCASRLSGTGWSRRIRPPASSRSPARTGEPSSWPARTPATWSTGTTGTAAATSPPRPTTPTASWAARRATSCGGSTRPRRAPCSSPGSGLGGSRCPGRSPRTPPPAGPSRSRTWRASRRRTWGSASITT